MSRVIRIESGASTRTRVLRRLAQALRAATQPTNSSGAEARDILAFLALGLATLQESVEETASAWERRGYWVKADQFRQKWAWGPRVLASLEASLHQGDLLRAGASALEIAAILADLRVDAGRGRGKAWRGAWEAWRSTRSVRC